MRLSPLRREPCPESAIAFLSSVAEQLTAVAEDAGLTPQVQIGEPWWWVMQSGALCLYDDAAKAAFGGNPVEISNVRGALTVAQKQLLDDAGTLLFRCGSRLRKAASNI